MGHAIDRLLLGGAFVFSGLIHRKVGKVDDRVGAVEEVVEDLALSPQVPGMPLPTGYGLQVKGPDAENILIPVCLPPGFELGSLVLKPSFLPEEEHAAAPAQAAAAAAVARPGDAAAPAVPPMAVPPSAAPPAAERPADRLGDAIQLVYTEESGFRTGGEGLVARPPAPPVTPERDASLL